MREEQCPCFPCTLSAVLPEILELRADLPEALPRPAQEKVNSEGGNEHTIDGLLPLAEEEAPSHMKAVWCKQSIPS